MKKIYLVVMAVFAFVLNSDAQKVSGTIRGILQDSTAQPLADATISVVRIKDSSLISFTISGRNGSFEIKNLEAGSYNVIASLEGLQAIKKTFTVSTASQITDLGAITMGRNYRMMDEVVIKDETPIKIKGDTVEFRADAFKSIKPNAVVEDLLKKIPGMEVDKDGTVKSQGEQVQKVYVDGKEFFGTDPKLATKNISQDMVESIQVYDDMSEQAKFTKIDDGSRSKAINIKLKKDKKNGIFGKAMAGGGTDNRFDASLSVNKFKGDRQISLIGAANNLNKQGFSFSDVVSSMGMGSFSGGGGAGGFGGGMTVRGGSGMFGGLGGTSATGISTPISLGLNYRDSWGPKVDGVGSLFGSQTRNLLKQTSLRQNSFATFDSATTDNSYTRRASENQNLRFNFRMEWKIDSMNSLLYYPSFTLQHSEGQSLDTTATFSSKSNSAYTLSQTSKNISSNSRDGYNMNQNLLLRHRFSKTGRTFTLGLTSTMNHSTGEGTNYSPYSYYSPNGSLESSRVLDQESKQIVNGYNNTISGSYTEPIGRNKLVELNYAYTNNLNKSDRKTYDYDPTSGKHDLVNMPSTNYFENRYTSHRAGLNFRVQEKKYNYQLGIGAQTNDLSSRSIRALTSKDTTTKQKQTNIYPTASFNYNFTRNKSLRFSYRGRTNQPSISQLQDVPDYSNPLQVKIGNPLLKQEFSNSFNLGYNTFNMLSFRFFSANLNFSKTTNKIVNDVENLTAQYANPTDPNTRGKLLIMPVNVNGAFTSSAFITLGFPFKNPKFKGSNLNATSMVSYNKDVSKQYQQMLDTKTLSASQSLGVNYTYKEKIDLGLRGRLSYNDTRYTKTLFSTNQDTKYWSQTYTADMTFTLPKNFILNTDFEYIINTGRADGYNQSIPLWNASFSKLVFKNKAGEIKLSAYDLLNQNISVTRNTGSNYYEDVRTNVLQQYFLLSFTYSINRMGGKNMMQQMPRGMQRGMRDVRIGD